MECSSENSFAWTDTSSDSVNSISMAADDDSDSLQLNERKETKVKKSKIKNNNELANLEPEVVIKRETTYCEKNNYGKKIKMELDSENDLIPNHKKKKKMKLIECNGNQNDLQDSMSSDEAYLSMKVKLESSTSSPSKQKLKQQKETSSIDTTKSTLKRKRVSSSSEQHYDTPSLKQETHTEISKAKKKKKKSKKQYDSDNSIIEDKMNSEEIIVTKQKHYQKNNQHVDTSAVNNTILQESEESDCDEISAIKCDDSHSLHTISFTNKSILDANTKVNSNESVNITKTPQTDMLHFNNKLQVEHRKQRISDRLRFEDDDEDSNIESSPVQHGTNSENNQIPLKLKQFLKGNPHLKLLSQTLNQNTSLTRDDEIWILKCPKEIDITDFKKTILNIHGKCKVKIAGQSYEGTAEEDQSDIMSLITLENRKYRVRNVPLNGIISLRKRIPKAHFRDDNVMVNNQTNFIPLPETKCRHPLFGSNYKKALKIPTAVAERLNFQDNEEYSMKSKKKKRNKKERNTLQHDDDQVQTIVTKTETEHLEEVKEKKKKKRKVVGDEGPAPKKMKQTKHDLESAEAWDSEKAIEENLFNF